MPETQPPVVASISFNDHGGCTAVLWKDNMQKSTRSKPITLGDLFDFVGLSPTFKASFNEPSPTRDCEKQGRSGLPSRSSDYKAALRSPLNGYDI